MVPGRCNLTIQPGATGSCTFPNPGRFAYREPAFRRVAWRGTITVRTVAGSLSIAARPATVTYGGAATLSGAVSSAQANERVNVTAGACGSTSRSNVAAAEKVAGGAWALAARPLRNTVYQARWRNVSSVDQTVNVPATRDAAEADA